MAIAKRCLLCVAFPEKMEGVFVVFLVNMYAPGCSKERQIALRCLIAQPLQIQPTTTHLMWLIVTTYNQQKNGTQL